jgi:hypothetical protein
MTAELIGSNEKIETDASGFRYRSRSTVDTVDLSLLRGIATLVV